MTEHPVHVPDHLGRSINWKQGLAIALGVPLLILPSLGYIPLYLSAAAILIWGLSVLQGFIQNTAYAELACTFPEASGLPGCAQHVFSTEGYQGKYDKGKLLGLELLVRLGSGNGALRDFGRRLPPCAISGAGADIYPA